MPMSSLLASLNTHTPRFPAKQHIAPTSFCFLFTSSSQCKPGWKPQTTTAPQSQCCAALTFFPPNWFVHDFWIQPHSKFQDRGPFFDSMWADPAQECDMNGLFQTLARVLLALRFTYLQNSGPSAANICPLFWTPSTRSSKAREP